MTARDDGVPASRGPEPTRRDTGRQGDGGGAEVRRILDECYAQARDTLTEHRDRLERLARALLAAESLDADQAYEAAGLARRGTAEGTLRPIAVEGDPEGDASRTAGPVPVGER